METTQSNPVVSSISPIENHKSALRHLPSYEEANIPYSLRLPAYRSSYIRRYHPYPRYVTPPPECHSSDGCDEDVLDLSILDQCIQQCNLERAAPLNEPAAENNEQENAVEDEGNEGVVNSAVIGYGTWRLF